MTSMELFRALGGVSAENLAGAEKLQMQAVPGKRRRSVKQAVLVAAIIALLLMLVGCAAVYVLHLQDLKVGDYRIRQNPAYDENGDVIPVPTHPLLAVLSVQGANQEALAQWDQFEQEYDPDGQIALAADLGQGDTGIPDNYNYTYGCYSWEMVEKLDSIVEKYGLKLLSTEINCNRRESRVLLDGLGIDPVYPGDVDYGTSFFYPEGTFRVEMDIPLNSDLWPYEEVYASYHYSRKEYFDPARLFFSSVDNGTQWHYTRQDGETVLLVTFPDSAWIFADKPEVFISIYLSALWVDDPVEMPGSVLEELAEGFDLDPQPKPVDLQKIEALRAEAQAADDAQREESRRQLYTQGYKSYIQQKLDAALTDHQRDSLYYRLYDVNGDGIDELISGVDFLSLRDGESYQYADLIKMNLGNGAWQFTFCEDNVVALEDLIYYGQRWCYLHAGADGVSYLGGLEKRENSDVWYFLPELPPDPPAEQKKVEITPEQAKAIQDSYVPLEKQPERQQMKRFGEPVKHISWTDPYAQYIAKALDQRSDAGEYTYALMDLNGDGVEELITQDAYVKPSGTLERMEYWLRIHTIVNGELVTVSDSFNGICENGILMYCEDDGTYYDFYRMKGTEMEMIEKFFLEPIDLYWGRVVYSDSGPQNSACSEEEAMKLISAYKPIELPMKPFSEYPFS